MKNRVVKSIVLICIIILLAFGSGYIGAIYGRHTATLTIHQVTPSQLAKAMQGDEFYSDYPQSMLLVQGKIASVTNKNAQAIVQFQTSSAPSVLPNVSCEMKENDHTLQPGKTISILTVAYSAERINTSDVLLHNCYLMK